MASSGSDNRSIVTTSTIGSTRYAHLSSYTAVGKPSKQRVLQILLNLYSEKDNWRKYGRLKTCCHNCIIISPVKCWWWMLQIFILLTVVVYTNEFFFLNWLAVVPAIIIAFLEWMAFYKTCLKDPGVMQRPDFPTAFRNLVKVLVVWGEGGDTSRFVTRSGGANEQVNFCWRCKHFRAVATSHCQTCDCCMLQHDHHCPVYGGCVAKNNMSSFHTMIISMGCFWLYTMGYCVYNMATTTESFVRRSNSTDYSDEEFTVAARITFYLILAEIAAILTLPAIISGCMKLKNNRETPQNARTPASDIPRLTEEILRFAQENKFSVEEELQLREVMRVEDEAQTQAGSAPQTTDELNHNHYFSTPGVSIFV